MKIACVRQGSNQLFEISSHLEQAFFNCREAVGHLPSANIYRCSKEEALVNASPDVFALFGDEGIESSLLLCKELSQTFVSVSILVFVSASNYQLSTLARFETLGAEVFSVDEPPVRIVHRLSQLQTLKQCHKKGKIITIDGAKGGVGTTTVTAGLAHAMQAFDKSAVVVDLSPSGALLHYLNTPKWHSPDYTAALTNNIYPDDALVGLCLTTAPNGICAILPPLGGADIRELWLRDQKSFEVTLAIIDILRSQFDYLVIDLAGAEGILPFALISRSDFTLLVSSNDPASVHLLNSKFSTLAEIPGATNLQVFINVFSRRGLNPDDITDFLYANPKFKSEAISLPILQHDSRGSRWIGTGNTIYTEGNKKTRAVLDATVRIFETLEITAEGGSVKSKFLSMLQKKALPKPTNSPLGLPYKREAAISQNFTADTLKGEIFSPLTAAVQMERFTAIDEQVCSGFHNLIKKRQQSPNELRDHYCPIPQDKLTNNQVGSFSLEHLMLVAGVVVAMLTLPIVFNYVGGYSNNYSETTIINK